MAAPINMVEVVVDSAIDGSGAQSGNRQRLSNKGQAQAENVATVFLDMRFSGQIHKDKCRDQLSVLGARNISSASDLIDTVGAQLHARRALERPAYKKFTEISFACIFRPRLDIFSFMMIIAVIQQLQNGGVDALSTASFILTLTFEFLICLVCLSERWQSLRKIFPDWIVYIKKREKESLRDAMQDQYFINESSSSLSPFDPVLWEYYVPFLVYFRQAFSQDVRVFRHKIPRAISPALLFTRSAANILIIICQIIYRFAVVSVNTQMFNQPKFNLPISFVIDPELLPAPTEFAVCQFMSDPPSVPNVPLFGVTFPLIIQTANILHVFVVFGLGVAMISFSLNKESIKSLRAVGRELKRHTIKYHNGSSKEESPSAFSLWSKINDFWVDKMFAADATDSDFLSEIMGFGDVDIGSSRQLQESTSSQLQELAFKLALPAVPKRLFILSLIPLVMTLLVPVTFVLSRNPSVGKFFRNSCFENSCAQLFRRDVIGNCAAASNTTQIWPSNYDYQSGCAICPIIVFGSFSRSAFYSIWTLSKCSCLPPCLNCILIFVLQAVSPCFF